MQMIRRIASGAADKICGNFRNLLAIVFSLLLIVFTACSMLLTIHSYVQTSEINSLQTTEETLEVYAEFWNHYLEQLKNRSLEVRSNADIMAMFERNRPFTEAEKTTLHTYLNYLSLAQEDLTEVEFYFPRSGYVYRYFNYSNRSYTKEDGYASQPWYDQVTKDNRYMYLESVQDVKSGRTHLLYHRAIIDISSRDTIAMVTYRIDSQILSTMFSDQNRSLLCRLSQDELFYGSVPSVERKELEQAIKPALSDEKYQTLSLNGEMYQLVRVSSGDWGLLRLIPMSIFRDSINQSTQSIFLLGVIFLLVQIVAVIIVVHSFTSPLREFTEKIDRIDSSTRQPVEIHTRYHEILRLNRKFNQLLQRIEYLYKAEYDAKLAEKTMRYKAMESQINSHFLYNTLQAVSTKALQNGDMEVFTMVNLLGRNFRYAIQQGEYVSLQEELDFCKNYVKLQCMRFGERLEVRFEVQEEMLNCLVPKFMVQIPIENAIHHELDGMTGGVLHLQVSGEQKDGTMILSVKDDGPGISTEKLAEVRRRLKMGITEDGDGHGLGLANLNSRLQFLYDTQDIIQLDSSYGEGFSITIRLPADERKEETR